MEEQYEMVTKVSTAVVHLSKVYGSGFSTLCGVYMGVGQSETAAWLYGEQAFDQKVAYKLTTCRTCKRVVDADQYLYDCYQEKLAAGLVEE